MGKHLNKQTNKLASRRATASHGASAKTGKSAFKRPGSMNRHKQA